MGKFVFVIACIFTCSLSQDALAAKKHNLKLPDCLNSIADRTCKCRANSGAYQICQAGQFCDFFVPSCK